MKPNIYLPSGYLDSNKIYHFKYPFTFIIGGRGTGKTYRFLKYLYESKRKFFYLRRTQSQVDILANDEYSPFAVINEDSGYRVGIVKENKYNSVFFNMRKKEDGKYVPYGDIVGRMGALSTFSNMRGFNGNDIEVILYDEFIPEPHERKIKNEYEALLNVYETVNRNRELQGRAPVKMICLANSNNLSNPIFMGLGIVTKVADMIVKRQECCFLEDRGICIILLEESPISEAKRDTVLYRMSEGTEFSEMAIDNEFHQDKSSKIKSQPLIEYKPFLIVGELCCYNHKSTNEIYCSEHKSGSPIQFTSGETDLKRFQNRYFWLWREYLKNNITFENYVCQLLFEDYWN